MRQIANWQKKYHCENIQKAFKQDAFGNKTRRLTGKIGHTLLIEWIETTRPVKSSEYIK